MDNMFKFWASQARQKKGKGLIEIDCSKKDRQKFSNTIASVFCDMDKFFVENDLYYYNNYHKFLDEKFMDKINLKILYPKFRKDKFMSENNCGYCLFTGNDYSEISIAEDFLNDKPTICHEIIHFLTSNYFYKRHQKNKNVEVLTDEVKRKKTYILDGNIKSIELALNEKSIQDYLLFSEGLTQYLTEQIYPEDDSKAYEPLVRLIDLLCDFVGKKNVIGDFLSGNINSIEKYFEARTWEGEYTGNFANFLKHIKLFEEEYREMKNGVIFNDIAYNFKKAQKNLLYAYLNNVAKKDNVCSEEEFLKVLNFIIKYGNLVECKSLLKMILDTGKIEKADSFRKIIDECEKEQGIAMAIEHYKVGEVEFSREFLKDRIGFCIRLDKNHHLPLWCDLKSGFDVNLNKFSEQYLDNVIKGLRFEDGEKICDIAIETEPNFVKVEFYNDVNKVVHTFALSYGRDKRAMFDDYVLEMDNIIKFEEEDAIQKVA